jgi:hypothetical protein
MILLLGIIAANSHTEARSFITDTSTNQIIFTEVGKAAPAQGFAYIKATINLNDYIQPLEEICRWSHIGWQYTQDQQRIFPDNLETKNFERILGMNTATCYSELQTLQKFSAMAINDDANQQNEDDHRQVHQPNTDTGSIWASIPAATVQNLATVNEEGAITQILTSNSNLVDIHYSLAHTLATIISDTREEIAGWRTAARYTANGIQSTTQITAVQRVVQKLKEIYGAALNQRLSHELFYLKDMRYALDELIKKVDNEGNTLLINTPMEILQCPAYFSANNQGITIVVEIPIISKTSELFAHEFHPWPLEFNSGQWYNLDLGDQVILITNHDRDIFRTMSRADWEDCYVFRQTRICRNANVLRTIDPAQTYTTPEYCLWHLFREHYQGIKQSCTLTQVHKRDVLLQLGQGRFIMRNVIPEQATVRCHNQGLNALPAAKTRRFNLPAGCTVQSATHEATVISSERPTKLNTATYQYRTRELDIGTWNVSRDNTLQNDMKQLQKIQTHLLSTRQPGPTPAQKQAPQGHTWSGWTKFMTLLAATLGVTTILGGATMTHIVFRLKRQLEEQKQPAKRLTATYLQLMKDHKQQSLV